MSIGINMAEHNLYEIPYSIITYSQISQLDLSSNHISEIPFFFFQLDILKQLNLKGNLLKKLPEEFCLLTLLEDLNLEDNELQIINESIMLLPSLKILNLSKNRFQQFPLTCKQLLNKLEVFTLGWFQLLGSQSTQIDFQHSPLKRHLLKNLTIDEFFKKSDKDLLLLNAFNLNEKGVIDSLKTNDPLQFLLINYSRNQIVDPLLFFYSVSNYDSIQIKEVISKVSNVNVKWQSQEYEWAAKLKIKAEDGDNALHITFRKICCTKEDYDRQQDIADLLINAGVEPNAKNFDNWTPLHIAMLIPQIKTLRWAIKKKGNNDQPLFDLNIKGGPHKSTLLHLASEKGYLKAIIELEFANVFEQNIFNLTPRNICTSSLGSLKYLRKIEISQLKFNSIKLTNKIPQRDDILADMTLLIANEENIDKVFKQNYPIQQILLAVMINKLNNSHILQFNQQLPILKQKCSISEKLIKEIKDQYSQNILKNRENLAKYKCQKKESSQNLDVLHDKYFGYSNFNETIFFLLTQRSNMNIESTRTTILEYENLQKREMESNLKYLNNYYQLVKKNQDQKKNHRRNNSETLQKKQHQCALQQSKGDNNISGIEDEDLNKLSFLSIFQIQQSIIIKRDQIYVIENFRSCFLMVYNQQKQQIHLIILKMIIKGHMTVPIPLYNVKKIRKFYSS